MLRSEQVDELVTLLAGMDRGALVRHFRCYRARFPVDFTEDFYQRTSLDRLRHIFLAMCLQTEQMPEIDLAHAA